MRVLEILAQAGDDNPKYLVFLMAWLLGAAMGGYLSERKGYGDKPGLVTGLVLSLLGGIIWLFVPPRENSDWKIKGPWGNQRKDQDSPAPAADPPASTPPAPPADPQAPPAG